MKKSSGAGSQGNFIAIFSCNFPQEKIISKAHLVVFFGVIPSATAVASKYKTWVEELVNSWVWAWEEFELSLVVRSLAREHEAL